MKKSLSIIIKLDVDNYMDVALVEEKLNDTGVVYNMSVTDHTGEGRIQTGHITRRRPDGSRRASISLEKASSVHVDYRNNKHVSASNLAVKHNISRASVDRICSGEWFKHYFNKRNQPIPPTYIQN